MNPVDDGLDIIALPCFAEPFSSLSHIAAALVVLVWGGALVWRGRGYRSSLALFVFCAVFLLSMSGLYHSATPGSVARRVFQRLDHAGIWLLIAGSFTPVHMLLFERLFWRWGVLSLVWVIAVAGLTLKTVFFEQMSEELGLALYLGLGWFGVVSGVRGLRLYGARELVPVAVGGFAYSAGALVDYLGWPVAVRGVIGPHELFHIGVIAGLFAHMAFIARHLDRRLIEGSVAVSGEA